MLGRNLQKLVSIGSAPLSQSKPFLSPYLARFAGKIEQELLTLLQNRNGFLAFEGALRVLPAESSLLSAGLDEWNALDGWRAEYGELAEGCLFFAEDAFGGQFCIREDEVLSFDPETGDKATLGKNLNEWAGELLKDYEVLTGYLLAKEWQQRYGPLAENHRLVPRIPFVCGGEFNVTNLVSLDAAKGMRIRAHLANQIRHLPDGVQIRFTIEP